jgi:RND family efflux transporter MFP subunit
MPLPLRRLFLLTALPGLAALSPLSAQTQAQAQDYECVMDAARIIALSARTPGVLEVVLVEKGQRVAKGDVIARTDGSMERAALKILKTRAASTAAIEQQTARLGFAQAQLDRAELLVKQNAQSLVKVEELRYEASLATSQLQQAKTDLASAQAEAERAEISIENTNIRATVAGVITEVSLSAGEYVTADRHVAILAQTDPIHVDAFLPAEDFPNVRPGLPVVIRPELPIGSSIAGTVLSVDPLFDTASRTFGIRVALANADNAIIGGQRCTLTLGG